MSVQDYVVLYGEKKHEDILILKNMFINTKKIALDWTELDYTNNMKIIEELINKKIEQIIFWGLEIGWDKLIKTIKERFSNIKVKVICNTNDSLLYYEYERKNFFDMLELSKERLIDDIAFLRKGQYETYKTLGYRCSYLRENYKLENKNMIYKTDNEEIQIGIYPLNYTWDKNIFNQLCIPKFIENSTLNYNCLDPRMKDFLTTMNIKANDDNIEEICEESLVQTIVKNDVIVATSFTEYVHPIFFISMELGIPCLIGNTSEFFDKNEKLKRFIVSTAEDNPIINSKMIDIIINNKEKIIDLYNEWKDEYNLICEKSKEKFLKL